jgi:nucleoside phosphorylase
VVIGTEVTRLEGTPFSWDAKALAAPLKPDAALLATVRRALETAGVDFHLGRIITLPSVAKTSAMNRWLGEALIATAVDMESYAAAQAAANAGVPFVAARAVIDVADAGLPAFVSAIDSSLAVRQAGIALKSLVRAPGDVALLPGLVRSFVKARRSVAASLMATAFELDQPRSSQPAAAA